MILSSLIQVVLNQDKNGTYTIYNDDLMFINKIMCSYSLFRQSPYVFIPFGTVHSICIGRSFGIVSILKHYYFLEFTYYNDDFNGAYIV